MKEIKEIETEKIKPDKNQPRKTFEKEEIEGLAKSYKSTGVINPIEVDKDNVIITGERRWRACKLAKIKMIPCRLIEKISPEERYERQVIENMHHRKMTPMEEARAFKKLIDTLFIKSVSRKKNKDGRSHTGQYNKYYRELSQRIGVSETHISNRLDLLEKPTFVQKDVEQNKKKASYYQENRLEGDDAKEMDKKIALPENKGGFKNPLDVREEVKILKDIKSPMVKEAILKNEITHEEAKDIKEMNKEKQEACVITIKKYNKIGTRNSLLKDVKEGKVFGEEKTFLDIIKKLRTELGNVRSKMYKISYILDEFHKEKLFGIMPKNEKEIVLDILTEIDKGVEIMNKSIKQVRDDLK